jgi:hypothetical protein
LQLPKEAGNIRLHSHKSVARRGFSLCAYFPVYLPACFPIKQKKRFNEGQIVAAIKKQEAGIAQTKNFYYFV